MIHNILLTLIILTALPVVLIIVYTFYKDINKITENKYIRIIFKIFLITLLIGLLDVYYILFIESYITTLF